MDIKQELREVIDLQKLRTMPTLDIEELCRDALAEIERLQRCMEQAARVAIRAYLELAPNMPDGGDALMAAFERRRSRS